MLEIKSGEEILGYVQQIKLVIAKLQEAYDQLQKIDVDICQSDSYYDGKAKAEIQTFCQSQSTHIQKLMVFYNKAAQYAYKCFLDMKFTDEELTKIIISLF